MKRILEFIRKIHDHPFFEHFIVGVIVVAGIVIGLETSPEIMERHGKLLHFIDGVILTIFVAEIIIKMVARWPRPLTYFKSGWNCFDFLIVVVCLLPDSGPWAAAFRMARILRALRLVSRIERLRVLVDALLRSLPSMFYVSILLGLHFYIYAVSGVFLFRENDPGHFNDLGKSLLTLFRVVTLEDWTDVMYTQIYGSDVYPAQGAIPTGPNPQAFGIWAILFFVSFVVVGAMVMINLFVGVMVNSISEVEADKIKRSLELDKSAATDAAMRKTLDTMENQLREMRRLIEERP